MSNKKDSFSKRNAVPKQIRIKQFKGDYYLSVSRFFNSLLISSISFFESLLFIQKEETKDGKEPLNLSLSTYISKISRLY